MTAHAYEVETVSTREVPGGSSTAHWSETVTAFQGTHAYGYPSPERFHARATRQRTSRFQRHRAADPQLTGADVAREVGWSLRQVQAVLQRVGATPSGLIREARLDRARSLLDRPDRTVTAVALASGFRSIDALEKAFRRRWGVSPSDYRRTR